MTRTTREDVTGSSLVGLSVLAYLATHEGWDVWLVGDSHRWATVVVLALGVLAYAVDAREDEFPGLTRFTVIALVAAVLASLALASGALTPLSLLVALVVAGWAVTTWGHLQHRRTPPRAMQA
jgi:uncharacterized membrane protein YGL010W